MRKGGRVVEGARLESVWARKGLASSNLVLSAKSDTEERSSSGNDLRNGSR